MLLKSVQNYGRLLALGTLSLVLVTNFKSLRADDLVSGTSAVVASWPSFQNGGRLSIDAKQLPLRWSGDKNIAWKVALHGEGQSSPIVAHGMVAVTSTTGANKERFHLATYNLDGKLNWLTTFENAHPEENSTYVSRAAPSPIADRDGFVALFEGGLIVALQKDGTERWRRELITAEGTIPARHGLAASLEQDESHVFCWIEQSKEPLLTCLNKDSGEIVWQVPGLGTTSWASPRIVDIGERQQLVLSGKGIIAGYDPQSGSRLWTLTDVSGNTTCSPIQAGKNRFLVGASKESKSDGATNSNGLIEVTLTSDGNYQAAFVWRATKATSSFGSPLVAGNNAYFVSQAGVLFEIDLESGKEQRTVRLTAGSVWSTPFEHNKHLYFFGHKGKTSILMADSLDSVAENDLFSFTDDDNSTDEKALPMAETVCAAIAIEGRCFIRTESSLYCIAESH